LYQGAAASNGQPFDATRLFSSLSFIILLAQPLFWMFEVVLDLSAAFGAFERIQTFLLEALREDYRDVAAGVPSSSGPYTHRDSDVELQVLRDDAAVLGQSARLPAALVLELQDASFAWTAEKKIVHHVYLSLARGQLAMIVGPVASGKTTLLKGLLGEVPHVSGKIWLGTDGLAWCDQSPWILVSDEIRETRRDETRQMVRLTPTRTNLFGKTLLDTLTLTKSCMIKSLKRASCQRT
jgi:ABC-type multidrug transport system fused ATPase/permease subunit